jgi:hypothetical protein
MDRRSPAAVWVVARTTRPLLACAAFAALGIGCASPTLPLPPPEIPSVAHVDADHVRLSSPCGGAADDAIVVVWNTNSNVPGDLAVGGAVASACGAWDTLIYAHPGDYLNVFQEVGNETSPPTTVQVH